MSNFGPYSYSRLATYKKCPLKFKLAYIDKIEKPYEPSPAMERGSAIHDSLEAFVLGHSEQLHPDIHEHYGQFFFSLREQYGSALIPEAKWALNWEWEVCDYDDTDCMVRGYMDLKFVPEDDNIQVFEYKSGNIYPEHTSQQCLYGTAALIQHPDKEGVDVTAIYVDKKQNKKIYYPASMLFEYKPMWMHQIMEIENAQPEDFIPKPHFMCRYCQFRASNGGPCVF